MPADRLALLPVRILLAACAALLAACAAPGDGAPVVDGPARGADPAPLTVMTYNIHHGEGTDGILDLARIADVITAPKPSLVALQEVDSGVRRTDSVEQDVQLAALTGMHAVFGEAIPYQGGSYGDAVLSEFPILDSEFWKLPASPGHEERVAVVVLVQPPGWPVIRFISTHFDHTSDPADRIAQTRELLRRAFPPGEDTPPTLLLGDLNAGPDSEPLRLLRERFASAAVDGIPTYPSEGAEKAIDWVLYTPDDWWQVLEVGTIDEAVASDHLPLRAVLLPRAVPASDELR